MVSIKNLLSKVTFQNYIQFLVLSIPPLLISGPFLPDLFVTISSFSFLIFLVFKNKFNFLINKYFFLFLTFYFILIISALLSDYKIVSLIKSISYLRFGIFIFVIGYLVNVNEQFIKNLLIVLSTVYFVLFFDALIQKITGTNILGVSSPYGRISSLFGDDIKLGGFIARLTPLLIAILTYLKFSNFLTLIFLFLSIFLTFLSGERISFAMTSFFFIVFFFIDDTPKKLKISLFISIIVCLGVVLFNFEIRHRIFNQTLSQINLKQDQDKVYFETIKNKDGSYIVNSRDNTFLPRVYHMYYETAIKIFKDNIFFGAGPGTYPFKSNEAEYYTVSDHSGYIAFRKKYNENLINEIIKKNNEKIKLISHTSEFKQIENNKILLKIEKYKHWLEGHGITWLDINEKMKDQNWLKEIGYLEDYQGFTNISGVNNHPHNTYLQLLSEVGLFGFLFILFFWFFSLYKFFCTSQKYFKYLILGIIINFFPFIFTGNFFNNWLSIAYIYPLGFLLKEKFYCIK